MNSQLDEELSARIRYIMGLVDEFKENYGKEREFDQHEKIQKSQRTKKKS